VRLIRALLEVNSLNQESHRLTLFNLIHAKEVKTNQDASSMIYRKKPNAVYYNLKSLLKKDIINSMLYRDASQIFSTDYVRAKMNCRKWLMQGSMLVNRKVYGEGLNILQRAQELANKFDLPGEQALIDETLRNYYIIREGKPAMEKYEILIHESNEMYAKHIEASNYMYRLSLPTLLETNSKLNTRRLRKQLLKLKLVYESTLGSSDRIGFYYHIGAINYYILTKQYGKAKERYLSFFILISKSISLNTISNKGGAYLEMTVILLLLMEFEEALTYANKAIFTFKTKTFNRLLAYEYSFLANYYMHRNKEAVKVFDLVQQIPQLKSSEIREEKWNYISAYNYYQLGETDKTKVLLDNCKNLMEQKSGWYLGKKLMLLMISIKEEEADPTIIQLENLLKVFRGLEQEHIHRFKAIYKIVRFLSYNQFDFKLTLEKQAYLLDLLAEGKDDYRWNPMGYEMIRFDEWFTKQIDHKKK
jgi:hypothetical protein|tara:strand:- start:995 stop:2419 length:1425 start_codon:yes stop_codon:yes gene_type:complete